MSIARGQLMAQSDKILKNEPDKPTLRIHKERLKAVHLGGSLMQSCRKQIRMKAL